ncbi:NfeD family protein [Mycolicibacterium aubagnense]|jgi:membrane protein implicated in regulation of membrane protease activity|uniref:Membrane protein n=1 Tax=Mycolicibacterium aubagnense TaxID=319707 RepID=A0ABM7I6Y2_9MYCO|nr:NfeD family protein [Mycolicibacterium aubagnense]TLH63092.1 hypothetical protein C1S80_14165 [Mycolicibacterium aubagnense]WGI30576.1 NfeD family protein [Mycolicibacterium aubagnense]BBX82503.1 membrane protein [Mycolicibacterium aubagnense]
MPVPLLWLILAIGLAGAEALTGDMFLLMLSGGALVTAGLGWATDWPIWADGASFLIVSVLLLVLVRPALRRRLGAPGLPEPVKALEGKTALVLDRVARHEGQVKLDGEIWTARPLDDDDVFEPGDHVTVVRIDGATAVVFRTI